ncbi:predicted protein [Botrytis cinerea T4]|uniref:Uncharacterized protein n=1 Tax=Botryotinia fuckeliana (strain T4) TaxID=999810 RepID=G2YP13_BOTF4|nr:predicted protein [Botrytis cinerea T4]
MTLDFPQKPRRSFNRLRAFYRNPNTVFSVGRATSHKPQNFIFGRHKGSVRVLMTASNASRGRDGADSGLIFRAISAVHNFPHHSS